MHDVCVIGRGLFGSIIARVLRAEGYDVVTVGEARPYQASRCAACLIKPSWLNKMHSDDIDRGMEILHKHYKPELIEFQAGLLRTDVMWVPPKSILDLDPRYEHWDHNGKAERIQGRTIHVLLKGNRQLTLQSRNIVVATGIWANELVRGFVGRVEPKYGAARLISGNLKQPFIKIWAPYKQIVAFNFNKNQIWAGDGSAYKQWDDDRAGASKDRVLKALPRDIGRTATSIELVGARPYSVAPLTNPCILEQPDPRTWVVTGGGKNGTIAAAWSASQLLEELK